MLKTPKVTNWNENGGFYVRGQAYAMPRKLEVLQANLDLLRNAAPTTSLVPQHPALTIDEQHHNKMIIIISI